MNKIVIVGVRIKKDNKILMVQEKGQAWGLWSLPMGHLDKNESLENGARREVKEETGYDIKIKRKIGASTIHGLEYRGGVGDNVKEIELHVFVANIVGGKLFRSNKDLLDVKWIPKNKIPELKLRGEWLRPYLR